MNNELKQMDVMVFVSLLKQSKKIDRFSSSITFISVLLFIVLLLSADNTIIAMLSLVVAALGLIEKYFAIRVDFDKSLFKQLQHCAEDDISSALEVMDQSLSKFGLLKKDYDPSRSLDTRMKGVLCSLKKQLLYCVIQSVFLLGGLLIIASF